MFFIIFLNIIEWMWLKYKYHKDCFLLLHHQSNMWFCRMLESSLMTSKLYFTQRIPLLQLESFILWPSTWRAKMEVYHSVVKAEELKSVWTKFVMCMKWKEIIYPKWVDARLPIQRPIPSILGKRVYTSQEPKATLFPWLLGFRILLKLQKVNSYWNNQDFSLNFLSNESFP